jgi:hypothetical protein
MELEEKRSDIVREALTRLSGKEVLDRVVSMPDPKGFVQGLSHEDFYWLVKKIGPDDCIPLLELASRPHWQYILDLEIWKRDELDSSSFLPWLDRLRQADCTALVKWLFSEAEYLAYHQFHKNLDVVVVSDKDDLYDIPEGFFTLDGTIYFRSRDPAYSETLQDIVKAMAAEDFLKYQSLFLGLTGFAPAELEEEMYRLRNVRLAEHGFLPFDEAMVVYSALAPETLQGPSQEAPALPFLQEQEPGLIPLWPFQVPTQRNLVTDIISSAMDPVFLDRMRLEFAGLCNMILSADGLLVNDPSILAKTSAKAISYINLAVQRLCGADLAAAEQYLKKNPLASMFRVGFGLALKVRWEAQRWLKSSWFGLKELGFDFWGDNWGGIIRGLVGGRLPKFYTGGPGEKEYKDFEWLSELQDAVKALKYVMVLDSLLSMLTKSYEFDEKALPESTFHPLIFNLWARKMLGRPLSMHGIEQSDARSLLSLLRSGRTKPPFSMNDFKEVFVSDFTGYISGPQSDQSTKQALKDAFLALWDEFSREYESVILEAVTPRYSPMLTVLPDRGSASQ